LPLYREVFLGLAALEDGSRPVKTGISGRLSDWLVFVFYKERPINSRFQDV
jgi:hypothetical protein